MPKDGKHESLGHGPLRRCRLPGRDGPGAADDPPQEPTARRVPAGHENEQKAQGRQIGKKIALTAIGYAVEKGASKLRLYTSSKLTAAQNLYRVLGFTEVKGKPNDRYKRKLILMELDLKM